MKIIPQELIDRWAWTPDKKVIVKEDPEPVVVPSFGFDLDYIINNYQNFKEGKLHVALKKALEHATFEGIVLTMPELIRLKNSVGKDHYFWKNYSDVHTEENLGIDIEGLYMPRGEGVVLVIHGGGLLTPERIETAITEGLINGSAKYEDEEFQELLRGNLPSGETIPIYNLADVRKEDFSAGTRRFGVALPLEEARRVNSGLQDKTTFLNNSLVIARNGGVKGLEEFFDKANEGNVVGNHHILSGRDPTQAQGRLLYLISSYYGLDGNYDLDYIGRFVGVAPKAHVARGGRAK